MHGGRLTRYAGFCQFDVAEKSDNPVAQRTKGSLSARERHTLLRAARRSIEEYFRSGRKPGIEAPPALLEPGAAFVTLRRRDTGELRGCRGEEVARRPLVESVTEMAIASAADDPRFARVTLDEVQDLRIEINVLTPLERIESDAVVVGRHGLAIRYGAVRALLLPQVPVSRAWTREKYLSELCRKGGLPEKAWRSPLAGLYAFETEAWSED